MILLSASEWGSVLLNWLNAANDFMWTYVIIVLLVFCAVYFTIRTRGVQFVLFKDMIRIMLGLDKKSKAKQAVKEGKKKKIGSFGAFAISLSSRVGTGNLAGVASAIVMGGPGAVFWMWIMALLGAANGFVTFSSLALIPIPHILSYGLAKVA